MTLDWLASQFKAHVSRPIANESAGVTASVTLFVGFLHSTMHKADILNLNTDVALYLVTIGNELSIVFSARQWAAALNQHDKRSRIRSQYNHSNIATRVRHRQTLYTSCIDPVSSNVAHEKGVHIEYLGRQQYSFKGMPRFKEKLQKILSPPSWRTWYISQKP